MIIIFRLTCVVWLVFSTSYGQEIQADGSNPGQRGVQEVCRPTPDYIICSGRGTCRAGVCDCHKFEDPNKVISGSYCECDNFSCDHHHGQMCAGPSHGECVCGRCICRDGFIGPDCACSTSTESCRSPENNEICSGRGQCICGQCVCDELFSGRFCDKCPTCPGKCPVFQNCVLCLVHGRGPLNGTHCAVRCGIQLDIVHGKIEANEHWNETLCSFYDDEDCRFAFTYNNSKKPGEVEVVRAQKDRECPKKL